MKRINLIQLIIISATCWSQSEIAKLLINHNAEINVKTAGIKYFVGYSPLMLGWYFIMKHNII